MRRVIAIALAGASLGGCSAGSWDMFKSAPPALQVKFESNPPGAEAKTSLGSGCTTPCSVAIPAPDGPFTVSYTLDKHQPASVPVNVIKTPGSFTTPATATTDPNPVFAELQPAVPPKPVRKKPHRPNKPKPAPVASTPASAAPAGASPFPDPNAGSPPQH
ncbi:MULTISPECIES: hypothetical protein [unclassified Bradyrhizobium]|uniref:hypothetical protein n=1 Tax=unclassified Bradyrhizobium TaxID=2631580 RepID=UPI00247A2A6F|nr:MULTISPECIES: hypothetical protein [unclassified Bradyrhizobium]WGR68604.1 hypothetical protein MTX24_24590 [Bradyrhizobium sp. ISRA426]WGR80659.1 hypothetical protein MTX21_09705 [Bradyrhizobium sp. ISRA430]WGR83844.1 hypothetical protein MTX25_24270 [Bradyrhizobium sp. ISRA432]